jgi:FMN phosphatase YigB (HAD superfamily)
MASIDKVESVLFDIGSTLVMGPNLSPNKELARILDTFDTDADRIGQIIMREEFFSPAEVWQRLRESFSNIAPSHLEKIKELWGRQINDAREIEGATEAVRYLKQHGYKIGLISDIWSPYYHSFEKACPEIAATADAVILSFREGIKKPSHEMFVRALSLLHTTPHRAVMVGDTYKNDLSPAMALGIKTVWVLSRAEREAEALAKVLNGKWPKPDYTIECIAQLKDLEIWGDGTYDNQGSQAF